MGAFVCRLCTEIENTATSRYALRGKGPALCSLCDPKIGKWHNRFPRNFIDGTSGLGEDGMLYSLENPPIHVKLIGVV